MKKKRLVILILSIVGLLVACVFAGCSGKENSKETSDTEHEYKDISEYKVTVDAEHEALCDVGQYYRAGEEVTVKLPTVTEHYYALYVNGEEQQMDHGRSDMEYTYFTFVMPDSDVSIVIEDHSVDIPEAPQQ